MKYSILFSGLIFSQTDSQKVSLSGKSDEEIRQMIKDKGNADGVQNWPLVAGHMLSSMATYKDAERLTNIALEMRDSQWT